MSIRTNWSDVENVNIEVVSEHEDPYAQTMGDNAVGLRLVAAGEALLLESSDLAGIREFAHRVVQACERYETLHYDFIEGTPEHEAAYGEPDTCADGCGLAVDHQPPCRDRPGGRVL